MWRYDPLDLLGIVTSFSSAGLTVWFTILSIPPPASSLYFTSAMSGFDPGGVAIHQETDCPRRREHGDCALR